MVIITSTVIRVWFSSPSPTFSIPSGVQATRHPQLTRRSLLNANHGGRFRVAKDLGIYRPFDSPSSMTTSEIIERIVRNRKAFEEKFERKSKSEAAYYSNKTGIQEPGMT